MMDDNRQFVFVYIKDQYVKVLSYKESLEYDNSLVNTGWVHTCTLDPNTFIKYLIENKDTDMRMMAIKSLTDVVKD